MAKMEMRQCWFLRRTHAQSSDNARRDELDAVDSSFIRHLCGVYFDTKRTWQILRDLDRRKLDRNRHTDGYFLPRIEEGLLVDVGSGWMGLVSISTDMQDAVFLLKRICRCVTRKSWLESAFI